MNRTVPASSSITRCSKGGLGFHQLPGAMPLVGAEAGPVEGVGIVPLGLPALPPCSGQGPQYQKGARSRGW